jgi:hypothetical protein
MRPPPLRVHSRRPPHERRRSGRAVHRCDDGFPRASRAYARGGCLMSFLSSPACLPLPSVGDGTAALVTATTGAATPSCSSRGPVPPPAPRPEVLRPFPSGSTWPERRLSLARALRSLFSLPAHALWRLALRPHHCTRRV